MKNTSDTIGNRTGDLPACSTVPQPTAPPRAPMSAVRVVIGRSGVTILERAMRFIFFSKSPRPALGLTQPPIQWMSRLFPRE